VAGSLCATNSLALKIENSSNTPLALKLFYFDSKTRAGDTKRVLKIVRNLLP
jgi:hypothetical protein